MSGAATRRSPLLRRIGLLAVPLALGLALATPAVAKPLTNPSWRLLPTGSVAHFRGLDAASSRVVWAAGYSPATVLRSLDGGRSWADVTPPVGSSLQFRDIETFGPDHAVVLASGNGQASRIYVTDDGGRRWNLAFTNHVYRSFFDCMAFFDSQRGLALSDPVGGKFRLVATDDGGHTWREVPRSGMPPALPGEFAFAASGTCIVTAGRDAWFGTGGAAHSRVFRSSDGGLTWTTVTTPIPSGPTSGIFSLAFKDSRHGIAVGGDFLVPSHAPHGATVTNDGGMTWTASPGPPGQYRSGSAYVPGTLNTYLAVGPTGSDYSRDGGLHWTRFDTGSFDAVSCARDGACFASGELGRVARLIRSGG
jgi:photosystem II stability/assembly factor-like uncharacterized protein